MQLVLALLLLVSTNAVATPEDAQKLVNSYLRPLLNGRETYYKTAIRETPKGTELVVQSGNPQVWIGRYTILFAGVEFRFRTASIEA